MRAVILGANDGIVSTASLLLGVAAATTVRDQVAVAGAAALVAGAMSMAVGEYVSVSSQRDTERADIARERQELLTSPDIELAELTEIYRRRGLDDALAREVATRLTHTDALGAHLRDELGLTETVRARPLQAALSSAVSFAAGAAAPLVAALTVPTDARLPAIAAVSLVLLGATGALGGHLGGAAPRRGAGRVIVGGGLAMGITWAVGELVGTAL